MQEQQQLDPLWDEGISSLLDGEYERLQTPFSMEVLRGYANQHAVRIGDIMETLFLMSTYGAWQYVDESGAELTLSEDSLNELYVKDRLDDADLAAFPGLWKPAG